MKPLYVAYALLFGLTAAIGVVNRRIAPPKPPSSTPAERRTSIVLGLSHTASLAAGLVLPWVGVGRLALSDAVAWGAVVGMVLAFAFLVWAMRTLGPLFTLALEATGAQAIVARGPYRLVRHPGYLAQIAMWVAFAVACRNAVVLAVVIVADAIGYGFRIQIEEQMLRAAVGERYDAYAAGRARLVPGIW